MTVRCSSPLLFNDPFDTQLKYNLGFGYSDLIPDLHSKISKYVWEDNEIKLDTEAAAYPLIMFLRDLRNKGQTKNFMKILDDKLNDQDNEFNAMIKSMQKYVENYLSTFKVFCLAEEFDNLLMWSHYAQHHTGVVLRFSCKKVPDTFLLTAKPINYQAEMPIFASLNEFVDDLIGLKRIDKEKKFEEYIYTKSSHWSYEKEWRVWIPREEYNNVQFVDLEILPDEIDGIIFGCRTKAEDKTEILELATKNQFNLFEVLQAKKNDHRFSLDFDNIK